MVTISSRKFRITDKIKAIRKTDCWSELGFVIPQIRISDDSNLGPNEYQLYLKRIPLVQGNWSW